jgi:hypothetical protein
MKKTVFGIILSLLFISPVVAQNKYEVVLKQNPAPRAISSNIVFVVDASSTINRYPDAIAKFSLAWDTLVQNFASDQLYIRTYVFHDELSERKTKWVDAGGPLGMEKFEAHKQWVLRNTGIYSWGLRAIKIALREVCPLDKNKASKRRLTIVLVTDGGLTEAANNRSGKTEEDVLNSTIKEHVYARLGSFEVVDKVIELEQQKRVLRGLDRATIVTIGVENVKADLEYGPSVKRPNSECQSWLKSIGKRYDGGYFYVRPLMTRRAD